MGHKKLTKNNPSTNYPDYLKKASIQTVVNGDIYKPQVIDMTKGHAAQKELQNLINENKDIEVIDNYDEQYAELLLSKHAHLYRANYEVQVNSIEGLLKEHYGGKKPWTLGSWVYFPWKRQLVHILNQHDFEALRTIRNRDLITTEEQKKLFEFETVCFGMSVGSAGALALGISGISRRTKLVDGAVISGSNLNRIQTGVSSVGKSKAVVIAREIYEMNPYSTVQCYDKVDTENIADIIEKPWKAKLVIDEIDDIEMKVRIRIEARKRRIPVLMATELGDTVMLDIERFDLEPHRQIFHGIVKNIEAVLESNLENHREWMKYAVKIIDPPNMPVKMQKSLLKIGSTIVTHPQLGSTVMTTGGLLAFAAKNVALGNHLQSGRFVISPEKLMLADHQGRKYKRHHKRHTKIIKSAIDSM